MSLPWRKRLDYRLLRWQARFEGSRFNRYGPWAFAAAFAVLLIALALARSRELSQDNDLAAAMQTVWLIGGEFKPEATLLGHNYLFEQGGFLIYPVALLAAIFPTAITLMVVQSVALALGVVPLWKLARNVAKLRVGTTLAIVSVYCVYSAVHAMNVAGFHLEVLALPMLMAAVYAGYRGTWIRYGVYLAVVLLARADLGLVVAGMGALWWFEGKRRLGYITTGVGLTWIIAFVFVVQPAYNGGDFPHVDAFEAYGGDDPFTVLWGIITSPVLFSRELLSQANFSSTIRLLAPVLFLPVVAPRHLLPVVPAYAIYLVAAVESDPLSEAGQNVPVTAFVFVALVFGLAKTGRVVVERVNVDRRVLSALLLTAVVFFVADSVSSPYQDPWSWGRRDAADQARHAAALLIPEQAVVRAAPAVLPLITERVGLYELRTPEEYPQDFAVEVAEGVNWIVFDNNEVPTWSDIDVGELRADLILGERMCLVLDQSGVQVWTFATEADPLGLIDLNSFTEENPQGLPCRAPRPRS